MNLHWETYLKMIIYEWWATFSVTAICLAIMFQFAFNKVNVVFTCLIISILLSILYTTIHYYILKCSVTQGGKNK